MGRMAGFISSMNVEDFNKKIKELKNNGYEVVLRPQYIDEYGRISYSAQTYIDEQEVK